MCVCVLHTEHNKQYRTRHQTEHIRTTKQNKANLPKRKATLSLLLKYSPDPPNASKEKDKDKKKNIYIINK